MPPINSIDGVSYQVRIKWRLHGQECLNVLNFKSVGSQDILTTLVQPILDCITDNLLPVLGNDITLQGADFKNRTGSVAQEGETTLNSANQGGGSATSLPSFNALVCNLRTTHPGRTGRGKLFLPGIPVNAESASLADAAFVAGCVAFLACMVSAFVAADPPAAVRWDWTVFSRKDNVDYPIQSATPNPVVAAMRSRKLGHGN